MTVEQRDIVDVMGIEAASGRVILTISDHLPGDEEHFSILKSKLRSYVGFIEGGQVLEAYPDAHIRGTEIRVVYRRHPSPEAERFLTAAAEALNERGIEFSFEPLPEGY